MWAIAASTMGRGSPDSSGGRSHSASARRSNPRPSSREVSRIAALAVRAAHASYTASRPSPRRRCARVTTAVAASVRVDGGQPQGHVRRYVDRAGGQRGLEAPGLGVAGDGQPRVGEEQGERAHQNIE